MIDILNSVDTREIATAIWLFFLIVWCMTKSSIRQAFGSVILAVTARPIAIFFSIAIAYLVIITTVLYYFDLWSIKQLKITVLWFLFAGISALTDIPKISKNLILLKSAITTNFKLSLLLDFFINLFKLPLLAELIFVPFAAILGGLLVVAQSDEKYALAQKFLNGIFIFIGLSFIAFESYKLLTSFEKIANIDTLRNFALPIIYNILIIPLIWVMSIYAAYESVFCRLRFIMKDHTLHFYAKCKLITGFRSDIGALNTWLKTAWSQNLTSRSDVVQSISATKNSRNKT